MHNSKPLSPSMIPLITGQGIQNNLWPILTYHVAPSQHRNTELQGCQQQHQVRRRIQWWRYLKGCNPFKLRTSQPIIGQLPNTCNPNRSQSNWNLQQWQNHLWPIVIDTEPPSKILEIGQYCQRKVIILLNSLIYVAPQELNNTQQFHSWTMKLDNHWNIASFVVTQNIRRFGTHHIPMNLAGFAKVLVVAQMGQRSNVLTAQTPFK